MKKSGKAVIFLLLTGLMLTGCMVTYPITYIPPASISADLGPGEAKACDIGVLFFPPFVGTGQASLESAIKEAVLFKGGDGLANVTVDYSAAHYLFYNVRCTHVKGRVVKAK